MNKFIAAAVLLAAVSTGCGSSKPEAVSTPAQTLAAEPAVATTTPVKPSTPRAPSTLTREQAAQRYLAIIKPTNAVFAEPKCKAAEEFFVDGGSWPPDGHSEYGEHGDRVLRDCYKRLVPMYVSSIKAFQTTAWPIDSRTDVADLVLQDQAFLYCLKKATKSTSVSSMSKALECFAEDDGSADRVRARFGLPGRDQG